jgi:ATP-binding protein involved in chromosome partitioning
VRHVIAVASGKGGVGKSTTAVNLALAMSARHRRVGILDADIYGPSIPRLLGLDPALASSSSATPSSSAAPSRSPSWLKPQVRNGKLVPLENYGVGCMSLGFLVDPGVAMAWRGPMVMSALDQLLFDVDWGHAGTLDVLVVDMPPGTGDIHLSLTQRISLSGGVVVSTPQDLALMDARRGADMFAKVGVPVLGVVENMSSFTCPACGEVTPLFGQGGAERTARELGLRFLGGVPLHLHIRECSDAGEPVTALEPHSPLARHYALLADQILAQLDGE